MKGPKKAKSRKSFIFVIDSYLKDSTFTAIKRDAKFFEKVFERGTICP